MVLNGVRNILLQTILSTLTRSVSHGGIHTQHTPSSGRFLHSRAALDLAGCDSLVAIDQDLRDQYAVEHQTCNTKGKRTGWSPAQCESAEKRCHPQPAASCDRFE